MSSGFGADNDGQEEDPIDKDFDAFSADLFGEEEDEFDGEDEDDEDKEGDNSQLLTHSPGKIRGDYRGYTLGEEKQEPKKKTKKTPDNKKETKKITPKQENAHQLAMEKQKAKAAKAERRSQRIADEQAAKYRLLLAQKEAERQQSENNHQAVMIEGQIRLQELALQEKEMEDLREAKRTMEANLQVVRLAQVESNLEMRKIVETNRKEAKEEHAKRNHELMILEAKLEDGKLRLKDATRIDLKEAKKEQEPYLHEERKLQIEKDYELRLKQLAAIQKGWKRIRFCLANIWEKIKSQFSKKDEKSKKVKGTPDEKKQEEKVGIIAAGWSALKKRIGKESPWGNNVIPRRLQLRALQFEFGRTTVPAEEDKESLRGAVIYRAVNNLPREDADSDVLSEVMSEFNKCATCAREFSTKYAAMNRLIPSEEQYTDSRQALDVLTRAFENTINEFEAYIDPEQEGLVDSPTEQKIITERIKWMENFLVNLKSTSVLIPTTETPIVPWILKSKAHKAGGGNVHEKMERQEIVHGLLQRVRSLQLPLTDNKSLAARKNRVKYDVSEKAHATVGNIWQYAFSSRSAVYKVVVAATVLGYTFWPSNDEAPAPPNTEPKPAESVEDDESVEGPEITDNTDS